MLAITTICPKTLLQEVRPLNWLLLQNLGSRIQELNVMIFKALSPENLASLGISDYSSRAEAEAQIAGSIGVLTEGQPP